MMKSTWHGEPEKRPSFSDIVKFFYEQNINTEDTNIDETDDAIGDSNSGYLDIYHAQTVIVDS